MTRPYPVIAPVLLMCGESRYGSRYGIVSMSCLGRSGLTRPVLVTDHSVDVSGKVVAASDGQRWPH